MVFSVPDSEKKKRNASENFDSHDKSGNLQDHYDENMKLTEQDDNKKDKYRNFIFSLYIMWVQLILVLCPPSIGSQKTRRRHLLVWWHKIRWRRFWLSGIGLENWKLKQWSIWIAYYRYAIKGDE